jgi:DNA-binding CsgD family transcriptional regulator
MVSGRSHLVDDAHGDRQRKRLTRRQEQVVQLAASGMPNKEIARHLGLSKRTVEDHFAAARNRWNAANRAELTAMAFADGDVARPLSWSDDGRSAGPEPRTGPCPENREFRNITIMAERPRPEVAASREGPDSGNARNGCPGRGRPTVMTPERIDAARELLRDHTIAQVARKLGIGRTTIYAHMAAITGAA